MSIEHCNTDHYGTLFKILDFMPKILKTCPIPYSLYGGRAIVAHLEHTAYIVPSIDEYNWGSYDFDIHTPRREEMARYIIDQILKHTTITPEQIHRETRQLADTLQRGIQLSLNICYRVQLPDNQGEIDQSYQLQFADIFEPEDPSVFENYPVELDRFDGLNYEPIRTLARSLEKSIRDRNTNEKNIPDYDLTIFNTRTADTIRDLEDTQRDYSAALDMYLTLCRARNTSEEMLLEVREELDESFDLMKEYSDLLARQTSYGNVTEFINGVIARHEHFDKVNKLRLRLDLVRELIIGQEQ